MHKGMSIPTEVGPNGGSIPLEGSRVIGQNVILALIPASSQHPFTQDISPDEDFIFRVKDERSGSIYATHVRKFFDEMERNGYARLLPGNNGIRLEENQLGEVYININYINMERDRKSVV